MVGESVDASPAFITQLTFSYRESRVLSDFKWAVNSLVRDRSKPASRQNVGGVDLEIWQVLRRSDLVNATSGWLIVLQQSLLIYNS